MNLVILTRRGIAFQKAGRGEQTIIYIPTLDSIKVYKDVSDTSTLPERYGALGQSPLWRQDASQTTVYGVLPEDVSQRRNALKVWLAQDFIPATDSIFYYIISPSLVVHGIRETTDEGHQRWKVTLLKTDSNQKKSVQDIVTSSISEQMLNDAEAKTCVAVYDNMQLYESFQKVLQPFNLIPIPFSVLAPAKNLKPLYRHADHTWIMLLTLLLGMLCVGAAISYWFVNWLQVARLEKDIERVRQTISHIQINPRVGHVQSPDEMINTMKRHFNQSPSAVLDAAARFATPFGELRNIDFTSGVDGGMSVPLSRDGQFTLDIGIDNPIHNLLLDQEKQALTLVKEQPWARQVESTSQGGKSLILRLLLQVDPVDGGSL